MLLFSLAIIAFLLSLILGISFTKKNSSLSRRWSLVFTLLACTLSSISSFIVFVNDSVVRFGIFQIAPQVELSFLIDRLAAFFIFIISIISAGVSIYSMRYVELSSSGMRRNLIVPMMNLFILSMLFFVSADNSLAQLIFWELMSLTSFFLVMINYEDSETRKAGIFYFTMTQLSTLFILGAVVLIYDFTGSFTLEKIAGLPSALNSALFILLLFGFGIKAGMIPFHKWLPYAHSSAPSNISALMSGVMIKVAIFGMIRYFLFILNPEMWWGFLILFFGVLSALLGVVYALKEHDIKRLLAYHSIENVGIILIGLGLYLTFQAYGLDKLAFLGLAGALFHCLNHAVFKSLLFLTAGSVVEETGTRNIEKMGGLVKTMPVTACLFLTGSIAISALPPLNGFVSELLIFQAFIQSFEVSNPFVVILLFICLSLFALTSALAAACFVKAFGIIFLAIPRSEKAKNSREVSRFMLIGPGIMALLCFLLGVFSYQIFQFLGYPVPIPNLLVVTLVIMLFLGLVILFLRLSGNVKKRYAQTWSCGLPSPGYLSEYTATGYSEPILTFFRPVYRTRKIVSRTFWDRYAAVFKNGRAEIQVFKIFEEKIYLPVARSIQTLSRWVSNSQNVDLDTFILYSFITIVILIVVLGWLN